MLHLFSFIRKLFRKKHDHKVEDVFTPSSAAVLTYVERADLISQIEKALLIPGMQLILYGHSGGGKTTLMQNILKRKKQAYISTNCMIGTTINEILLDAFDKLNPFYTSEKQEKVTNTINAELKKTYLGINAALRAETKEEYQQGSKRALPIQLTPQRLAEFLGEANVLWIIEDFHKVEETERQKLSQILKIFVDASNSFKNVKIIAIGAVGTARDIVNYDNELTNRISEIFIPLMNQDELESIITKGERLLNFNFNGNIHDEVIKFSNSLAAICHQLCFSMCYNNDILKTQKATKILHEDKLEKAVVDYLKQNSDSFKEIFDRAIKQRDGINADPSLLIEVFCNAKTEELTSKEIGNYKNVKKTFKGELLNNSLQLLTTPEYGEILRFDNNSGKYFFSNPFFKAYSIMRFASEEDGRFKPKSYSKEFENLKRILEIIKSNNGQIVIGNYKEHK